MLKRLRQLLCKHQDMPFRTEGNRLFLQCLQCGKESKGIITGKGPQCKGKAA